ncbi:hypothetical protein OKW76_00400 [Sphingomonas sp. S1-29]|uniref:hypothetical protein n=1 Tax=Sphingomonas sp. S1-29 TaxID=2991074 RepID=UPI00223FD8FF|nr:hypothetical protein [Sphingomonas sp. S1-29]UZK69585.1 hypothetical protein OKW76_00400 [Sphingomonas sp. S1-29]
MLEHYKNALSPRAFNQVAKAITDPNAVLFNQRFLLPHLIGTNSGNGNATTIALADQKRSVRLSNNARSVLAGRTTLADYCFFTNPLLDVDFDDALRADINVRVEVAPFVTLTLEFDEGTLEFFEEQLGWARGVRAQKPLDRFVKHLRDQFYDLRGLTANLSGNKSIHYHFTFSTDQLTVRDWPIDGYKRAWSRLEAAFVGFFGLSFKSDPALKNAGHFRRIPGGTRNLDKPNIFGMPAGTAVPQAVIYDEVFDRAAKGSTLPFLRDQDFAEPLAEYAEPSGPRTTKSTLTVPLAAATAEDAYIHAKMLQTYPAGSYPSFEGFVEKNGLRAVFLNSPSDTNPESYMDEFHNGINIAGNDPLNLYRNHPRLPDKLGVMIERWKAEYRLSTGKLVMTHLPALPFGRERTQIETDFAWAATDYDKATEALTTMIKKEAVTFDASRCTLINAPEGISKTRSLIEHTRWVMAPAKVADRGSMNAPIVMFAFSSYEAAEEKMEEFAATEARVENLAFALVPVLIKSFSRLYAEFLSEYQAKALTHEHAEARGYNSLAECIRAEQPEALSFMRAFYEGQWAEIERHRRANRRKKAFPVFFTVHGVAHDWEHTTPTRMMFSRAYWAGDVHTAREETRISLLIHDELSAHDLVQMVPREVIDYVAAMVEVHGWQAKGGDIANYTNFRLWSKSHPVPFIGMNPLTFHDANRIAKTKFEGFITIANSGEYPAPKETTAERPDIYGDRVGSEWGYAKAEWTQRQRTLLLTTETVTTAVARWCGDIDIIELDTPRIPRHPVWTKATRLVSDKLADAVEEFREAHGELSAVSNKVAHLDDTKTHHAAKGSNAYMGRPMLQTMVMMSPHQWEQYEAYNALTGRDNLVRLRHIDEYNQTAGRNLGFRFRSGAEHHLIINLTLYRLLKGEALDTARYEMIERSTARQRYKKGAK